MLSCLDDNLIGDKGMQYLSKGNWKSLAILRLNENKLTGECMKYFNRGNWPSLISISFCK